MTLLELLGEPGVHSTTELAAAMDTDVAMIQAKLEHYARLGYVKKTVLSPDCQTSNCGSCRGCPRQSVSAPPLVYWERVR